jgi:AcrR family transcriptional regulator
VDIRENIIKTAEELFLRFGFKRVTMDDIARELAISKKTIYQYFKDKNEIVCSATERHLHQEQCQMQELEAESENVIEYLVKLSKQLRSHVSAIHPGAMEDLKKYYPQGWKIYEHYKKEAFLKTISKILKQGIQEGYFRADIDPEMLAIMRIEQVQMAFDESLFPRSRFDFTEVHVQLLRHFIAGIITDKGRELMKHYSNSTTTNEIIF